MAFLFLTAPTAVDKAQCLHRAVVNYGAAAIKPDFTWRPEEEAPDLCRTVQLESTVVTPEVDLQVIGVNDMASGTTNGLPNSSMETTSEQATFFQTFGKASRYVLCV